MANDPPCVYCTLCGKCLICQPHTACTRGCGGPRSNGNSFGPDRVKPSWEMAMLAEAQVTFWKLI